MFGERDALHRYRERKKLETFVIDIFSFSPSLVKSMLC